MCFLNLCQDFKAPVRLSISMKISPSLPPNNSLLDRSTSPNHPTGTLIMMLCCFMQYSGHCFLSIHFRGPYFLIFFSSFYWVQLSIHEKLISTAMTFFSLWSMNLSSTLFCCRCSYSANTGTSYKDFGSTRKYYGGSESASPKSLSISKNSTWRAALHLEGYLFCVSAGQPARV